MKQNLKLLSNEAVAAIARYAAETGAVITPELVMEMVSRFEVSTNQASSPVTRLIQSCHADGMRLIPTIKRVREEFGYGLREAKDAVDALELTWPTYRL
jgi:ribosomal protein L7/L12